MLYIPSLLAKWKRGAREGYHFFSVLFEGMVRDVQHRIVLSYFVSSSRLLIHGPGRTKGMIARVSFEPCFEDAIVTT